MAVEEIITNLISGDIVAGKCAAPNCPNEVLSKGCCTKHYQRVYLWLKANGLELQPINQWQIVTKNVPEANQTKAALWAHINQKLTT